MGLAAATAAAAAEAASAAAEKAVVAAEAATAAGKAALAAGAKAALAAAEAAAAAAAAVAAKYGREILVLFEMPSGFAIFCLNYYLNKPKAMEEIWQIFGKDFRSHEIVWLKEFRAFKDKSSAINHSTGVSKELTEMILRHHSPFQILAVGKSEYKTIIEANLREVPCRFDETVMEVMWGLQNLMHSFLPKEVKKLRNEDRLPMCQGIKIFLDYGFDVKPEMVNEKVITVACVLFDAELTAKRHAKSLCVGAGMLKDVSGINSEDWSVIKIAKALKIMVKPLGPTEAEMEMFTREELSALVGDKYKYEGLVSRDLILKIHNELVEALEVKKDILEILPYLFRCACSEESVGG